MYNFLQNKDELAEQIRNLFFWFYNETAKMWADYDSQLYVVDEEAAKQLTAQLSQKRAELIKEGAQTFPDKNHTRLAEMILSTLDQDSERARDFATYTDYYLRSIDTHLDCFSTIGAHGFVDTIILDSLEKTDADTIRDKYKSLLDKQANALFAEYEDYHEIIWDNVYLINFYEKPTLYYFGSLIEHKNGEDN